MQETRFAQMDQQPLSYELMFSCYLDVGVVYESEQTKSWITTRPYMCPEQMEPCGHRFRCTLMQNSTPT